MAEQPRPFTVRRTRWMGKPAELLTFTGTTPAEFDAFCDARFAPGREGIGWRTDNAAPTVVFGGSGAVLWRQFRRWVVEEKGGSHAT